MTSVPMNALAALMIVATIPTSIARTLQVGVGQAYALPSEALSNAEDGDVIAIDGGVYNDCAVIVRNNIVLEGRTEDVSVVMSGKACQGKAALVTAGNGITIRNMTLENIHVAEGNGAGIRAEGKDLTVDHVKFIANENGILTSANPASTIVVRDSEFVGNGACIEACAHGIYAGHIGLLRVVRSRFVGTQHGHHIKSRALRTEVLDCDISDGPRGTASYLIDIPDGGAVVVRGNKLEKGPLAENRSAAISVGAESQKNVTPEIRVDHNNFRNDGGYDTVFLVNRTSTEATMAANSLTGRTVALEGVGTSGSK